MVILPVTTVQEFRTQSLKVLDSYINQDTSMRRPLFLALDSLGMLSTTKEVEDTAEGKETPESSLYVGKTKFHHHLQTNRQQIICDICTAIDVTKISQENLCCLNTTIILLIFSNIHGTLVEDVEYLKRKEKNWQNPGSIVISFRRLLWFWDRYYHRRAHDRLSLEMSSRLPFHMFDEVVEILVKENAIKAKYILVGKGSMEQDIKNYVEEKE